ncbi:hypothetical protein F0562_034245 [Nyssa sinensis]|uniref:Protein-tyrosine-phosphatase n=1 Tax=Nyssa sinensis TaxID=561372 RepID=A0A5J5AF12_9ASTE|nr:hypothetical protein F0562_034245 [Nyssa sinensis]
MLGEEDKDRSSGGNRRTFLRSVSWTDRSPVKRNPRPQTNSKVRSCLPPLQPLSVSRKSVEEWPKAGSDDLGVWPQPPTPGAFGSVKPLDNSDPKQPPREFQLRKDKLAFFDKECSRIADHIYLGSDAVAKNREILRQNGITHVLNCVGFVSPEYFKSDLVYKTLWLQDTPSEDITSILYDVFDYFEDVREQGGRVLVHCCQGVSRSTSLVIAYLMWREGQSFEDAFQYVKAARGVTNPNMGFACQLLQCQKRVHAVPASPNSVLRIYRMAPHSPYDALHLVPKMLNHPSARGLDSRGAFLIHVPSAIYVWIGKNCTPVMSDTARAAAFQVIRYERAQGPVVTIKEGEELSEFWDALANGQLLPDGCSKAVIKEEERLSTGSDMVGLRKVDEYDRDFEVFNKALAGGVVPPFPLSGTESETCLPARENGWCRLRRKFASGMMKELITSTILSCGSTQSINGTCISIDTGREVESPISPPDSLLASSPRCGSPDSFSCYPICGPASIMDNFKEVEQSVPLTDPSLSSPSPCASPDSFSCFPVNSPKFSSKSPLISPSTSDYSSSFTFSPSSSNWSDLSILSSQPSPSGLESTDPYPAKNASLAENASLRCKGTCPSLTAPFSANHALRMANTCLPCKGTSSSIAERRGSNPPPPMRLPSVDEASQVPQILVRSWSFSLPDLEDDMMADAECNQFEQEGFCELNREEQMLDADIFSAANNTLQSGNEDKLESNTDRVAKGCNPILYQWPTMDEVELDCFGTLDSRSVYVMLIPKARLGTNNPDVLYIWLGCDVSCEEGQRKVIGSDDSHVHWETVGRNFLNQMGLPLNSSVQIVKEGEEPEELRKHLYCFSFPKG